MSASGQYRKLCDSDQIQHGLRIPHVTKRVRHRGQRPPMFRFRQCRACKIIVNVDAVRFMQRITDTTSIYFGNDDAIRVKETPDEILMLRAL
jgi:hypothetical protein